MVATISCRCGYRCEAEVETRTAAEVLADRHESTADAVRRPYRHGTTVVLLPGTGKAHAAVRYAVARR